MQGTEEMRIRALDGVPSEIQGEAGVGGHGTAWVLAEEGGPARQGSKARSSARQGAEAEGLGGAAVRRRA